MFLRTTRVSSSSAVHRTDNQITRVSLINCVGVSRRHSEYPSFPTLPSHGAATDEPARDRSAGKREACDVLAERNRARVWEAITASSSVGITHTDGACPSGEMHVLPRWLASGSMRMPSHARPWQTCWRMSGEFSPMPAVKTERVQAAQCRRERADLANDAIDEELDRLGRQGAITGQENAHVVADAGDPQQAGFLVEEVLDPINAPALPEQEEDHAGIESSAACAHRQPIQRREAHRGIHALAVSSLRRGWRRCRGGRR